jgi:hypothetical protein
MSVTATVAADGGQPSGDSDDNRRPRRLLIPIVCLAVGVIAGFGGHRLIPRSPGHDVTVIDGTAQVGNRQFGLVTPEWHRVSGAPLSRFYQTLGWTVGDDLRWVDAQGHQFVGGTPSCLRVATHPHIQIGVLEARVHGSQPSSLTLAWLKCLSP